MDILYFYNLSCDITRHQPAWSTTGWDLLAMVKLFKLVIHNAG
jgi:hypothetical protein